MTAVGMTGAETDVTPLRTDVAGNPRKAAGARKPQRTGGEIGAGMTPDVMTGVGLPVLAEVDLSHRHSETAEVEEETKEAADPREAEVGVVPTTEEDLRLQDERSPLRLRRPFVTHWTPSSIPWPGSSTNRSAETAS